MCAGSPYSYDSRRDPRTERRARIREIAQSRLHFAYWHVYALREQRSRNSTYNLMNWLYREEGLAMRRRCLKRRVSARCREACM